MFSDRPIPPPKFKNALQSFGGGFKNVILVSFRHHISNTPRK